MEFGGSRVKPNILSEHHVRFMAEHLPQLCAEICNDRPYVRTSDDIKLTTSTKSYRTTRLFVASVGINYKLQQLQYHTRIFFMIHNQQLTYTQALSDVINYALLATTTTGFVLPPVNANTNILYPRILKSSKHKCKRW
jgi:hypothetical protein